MNRVVFEQPKAQTACTFCGAHVSDDFRRVFGDEDNVAHRCLTCDSRFRVQKGSATGKEVDHPDPQNDPNRNRGPRVNARTDGGDER